MGNEIAMSSRRKSTAQALCHELFREVEGSLSDAWVSDEPSTDDPAEYLRFVHGNLLALEEARGVMKRFLKRHRYKPRVTTPKNCEAPNGAGHTTADCPGTECRRTGQCQVA